MMVSLPEIARAVRGEVAGRQVLAPGPGHSSRDRSLSIRLSDESRDGFVVHSHCGDDWRECRDHVADALGLPRERWQGRGEPDPDEIERRREARRRAERADEGKAAWLRRRAIDIWHEGRDPTGTLVERYLNSRGLVLPPEVAGSALRFHPLCPWGKERSLAMIAAMRCIRTGEIRAIHRTALTASGEKVGRKMLAAAAGTAVMLDASDAVTIGLAAPPADQSN